MAHVFVGTSGYSFKAWRGAFYPAKLAEREFLPYYAERLATVELNNTFYRTPTPEAIDGWCARVPPDFKFSVKAPQRITHVSRLKDARELVENFAQLVAGFGEQLGVVLFQFPPQFRSNFERLREFREAWPRHVPTALEFRNPSWDTEEIRAWCRSERLAWVINDSDEEAAEGDDVRSVLGPEPQVLEAAAAGDVAYVRLRRQRYTEQELWAWADAVGGTAVRNAFVFFKHEVSGPGYAQLLRARAESCRE